MSGLATYNYTITGSGENQFYEFSINTQAQLTPVSPNLAQGNVNNQWVYQIATAGKTGVVLVQKSYYVPEHGTKFRITFAISEDNRLTVASMSLDQIGSGQAGS